MTKSSRSCDEPERWAAHSQRQVDGAWVRGADGRWASVVANPPGRKFNAGARARVHGWSLSTGWPARSAYTPPTVPLPDTGAWASPDAAPYCWRAPNYGPCLYLVRSALQQAR